MVASTRKADEAIRTLRVVCFSLSSKKPLRLDEEQGNVLWDDNPVYIGVHGWQNKWR